MEKRTYFQPYNPLFPSGSAMLTSVQSTLIRQFDYCNLNGIDLHRRGLVFKFPYQHLLFNAAALLAKY